MLGKDMAMRKIFAFVALLGCCLSANADVVSLVDSGWYDNTGYHDPSNLNYIAGRDYDPFAPRDISYKNFFVFDLSEVGAVSSATLTLDSGYHTDNGTFTLVGVEEDLNALRGGGIGLTEIYDQLDSGLEFGQVELFNIPMNDAINISLNDAAIASINSGMDQWAIAGYFDYGGEHGIAFSGSGDVQPILTVTISEVPIPASLWLFGSALFGLGSLKLRRT